MDQTKKPGRPPKGVSAMTTAQRVKQSRDRAREAMLKANENLSEASDKAIIGNLERQIKLIAEPDYRETARYLAASLMKELCNRYEIRLEK